MNRKARKLYKLIQGLAIIDVLLLILCAILAFKTIDYRKENARLAQTNEDLRISLNGAQPASGDQGAMNITGQPEISLNELPESDTKAILRNYAEQGKSFITTLKTIFPDQFVIADEGKFYFMDIDPSLRPYAYDSSRMTLTDEGVILYEDETMDVSYGIDVSQHNGEIDWEEFKKNDYIPEFIYIRLGLRGYESGKLVADTQVSANLIGARESGAEIGVYFVTQAVNEEEAREEARFVIETLSDNKVDLPVALDVEKIENYQTEPRTQKLTAVEYTQNVLAFVDELKQYGYETIIYGNGKSFMLMMDITKIDGIDKWFADYVAADDYTPYFPYDFSIWQFSSQGYMQGITGDVDLNIRFKK